MYLLQVVNEDNIVTEELYRVSLEEVTEFIADTAKTNPELYVRVYVELPREIGE